MNVKDSRLVVGEGSIIGIKKYPTDLGDVLVTYRVDSMGGHYTIIHGAVKDQRSMHEFTTEGIPEYPEYKRKSILKQLPPCDEDVYWW